MTELDWRLPLRVFMTAGQKCNILWNPLLRPGIQRQTIRLLQLHRRFELFSQPEQMLGSRLHGFLVATILDDDGSLQHIASGLLQWCHLRECRKLLSRHPGLMLVLCNGVMQHPMQENGDIIVDKDIALNHILSHKAGRPRLAFDSHKIRNYEL